VALTELPWKLMGRRVRPYAFSVMYVTGVVSWGFLITRHGPSGILDSSNLGILTGLGGLAACLALFLGFALKRDCLMLIGLLGTSGVWFARGVYIMLERGFVESALLSFGWVFASIGAFFLEFLTGDHDFLRRRRV
jgi:hypothetical protein